jgi:RNA polymerase sigma-70 factor, ECF subfamily
VNLLEQMDDDSLMKRYVETSDREALGTLFLRHASGAYTTALRVCRNQADAEDAVQSAFVYIMQNAANYRGGNPFAMKTWIARIVIGAVKNKIRSEVRRRTREEEVVQDSEDVALPAESLRDHDPNELTGEVYAALNTLPEHYRLPIVLHHCEGMSLKETAETLQVSPNTLSMQLARGMKIMRRTLAAGGVMANSTSILAALPLLPSENAPAPLLNSIGEILAGVGRFLEAAAATEATAASLKPAVVSMGTSLKLIIVVGLIALATVGTLMIWERGGGNSPVSVVSPIHTATEPGGGTNVYYRWDFNTLEIPKDLKLAVGSWRCLPTGGPDGSGCLETEQEPIMVGIDIPIEKLPIRVTCDLCSPLPLSKAGSGSALYWRYYNPCAVITGIGDNPLRSVQLDAETTPWSHIETYVSENHTDRWANGYRVQVSFGERMPGSKLCLYVDSRIRIDNLEIRSVREDVVPDVNQYRLAIEKIPPQKRVGRVALPGVKPGKYSQVAVVTFRPGQK